MNPGRLSWFRWACGVSAGIMVFFTFGIARPLFQAFPRETAGAITAVFFPYYFGAILLGFLVAAALVLPTREKNTRCLVAFVLVILALAAISSIAFGIGPAIQRLPLPEARETFRTLHAISMALNLLAMTIAIGAPLVVTGPARKASVS